MAYPLLAEEVERTWAEKKGVSPPRWSAGIGVKDYEAQARKELRAGNVTPTLGWTGNRAYTASDYYTVLDRMKELNPRIAAYQEAMAGRTAELGVYQDKAARLQARIGELQELKRSYFYGNIDWIQRKMIDWEIEGLQAQLMELGEPEPLVAPTIGYEPTPTTPEYLGEYYEAGMMPETEELVRVPGEAYRTPAPRQVPIGAEEAGYRAPTRLPIPSWMEGLLETSMGPVGEAGMARGAYTVRPLGAQAKLGPEKLAKTAGYLGWGKAGAPLRLGESYLQALEQLPAWWQEYTALSEKLFPKAVSMPRPTWRSTYQR